MVPQFVVGTAVVLFTEAVSLGSGMALYSKLLQPEAQGLMLRPANYII